jgi:hypothetical protein
MLIRTSKTQLRFSRRNFLQTVGAGLALLPMIEADPADAAACYVGGIKRLFIFAWADGMLSNVSTWATTGTTPAAWSCADFQSTLPSGGTLTLPGTTTAPTLSMYQPELILLHGVDYDFITEQPNPNGGETNGHACFPGMLTGANYQTLTNTDADVAGGVSMDQYISQQMVKSGYSGIPYLSVSSFMHSTGRLSWSAAGQKVDPNNNPFNVWSTYFAGKLPTSYTGGDAGAPVKTPPADAGYNSGQSILDYVTADLNRFMNTVGAADKASIQAHLEYVQQVEKTLVGYGTGGGMGADGGTVAAGNGCASAAGTLATLATTEGTAQTTSAQSTYITTTANIPTMNKLLFDMSVAAFAADMTRVITMQCGDQGDSNLILSWLGYKSGGPLASDPNTGDTNGFHAQAHENSSDKKADDTWFQHQLAYMIGNMKSVADMTGSSILDSSLFLAMNNMRTGTHETTTVPVVMAGSLGGYFKTGQSLAPPTGSTWSNNQLLMTILNGFGYGPFSASNPFGTAKYCTGGPLTQLLA